VGSYGFFFLPARRKLVHDTTRLLARWRRFVEDIQHPFRDTKYVLLSVLIAFFDTTLLGLLWVRHTTTVMPSPWQAVTVWFFVIFTLTTLLLFYIVWKHPQKCLSLPLVSLHLFTMYAVAALLYPLGYGFDAFIHRATEEWIFHNGFILPKQPYYIGQYSLVVFLAHITQLSTAVIDVYLVPILAALILPATISSCLRRIWKIIPRWAFLLPLGTALLPFLSLHLTTPHNLVIILSILIVFTTLAYQKDGKHIAVPLLLSFAAIITHALLGAPLLGFVLTAIILRHTTSKIWKNIWLAASALGQLLLLPAMFTINNLRGGYGLPEIHNPLSGIQSFLALFARPYWYVKNAPLQWELLYAWERMLIPVALIITLLGFIYARKKIKDAYLYPLTAVAMFLSAWLLHSWITFPNVIVYEQGNYPLRLVKGSMFFLLPWMMYGIYALFQSVRKQFSIIIAILFAGLLTVSFYFSYPQRNPKVQFPGFNVTQADFDATEWIHNNAPEDGQYIVLANQLTSAAALTTYSFAKNYQTKQGELFYYAIPTGGPLYAEYSHMLYEGQKREYMDAAMDLTHVDTSYFVINSYWKNFEEIVEGAKKSADSWQIIDDGSVWIFEYTQERLPQ